MLVRSCSIAALALAVSACSGPCRGSKPYVPYTIDEAGTSAAVADASAPVAVGAGDRAQAQAPPAGAHTFSTAGITLEVPQDKTLALVLVAELTGDAFKDALAVVTREGAPPELLFFKGRAGGVEAPLSAFAATKTPLCESTPRLAHVGPHSAYVELGACGAADAPRRGTRDVAALAFDRGAPRVRFSATITDEAALPKLSLEVDAADRDGDGIDDLSLRVALEGGGAPFEPGPRVSAQLKWLDRPAGLSREPDEPEASFRAVASTATARATKPKDAASVPGLVHQLWALARAICPEAGSPRLVRTAGADPSCGASKALEEAQLALVRAHVTLGDPLRAIAAIDRMQRAPASRTPARAADAQAHLAQAAPSRTAIAWRVVAAVPKVERGHAPAWSPLAFESTGKLLVRTAASVVRVDATLGDETEADGVPQWKTSVVSPSGNFSWIEAYDPCDAHALQATFAPLADGDAKNVALPIAPVGPRCASKGEPASVVPVAWGTAGLEAVVASEPILFSPDLSRATPLAAWLDQPYTYGAPRSPDGKSLAIPTSQGILVRGPAGTRLYKAKELEGATVELRGCVVSDDATRVACVRSGRAFVGTWEP